MKPVLILGCATNTLSLAPFDGDYKVWASGQYQDMVKRFDEWWELHDIDLLKGQSEPLDRHLDWLGNQERVVIARPHEKVPNGIVHDFDFYLERHGSEFFTSTISWMMAKAIEEERDIGLYGVEMATDGEYAYQRAGVMHFISLAESQGIKVTIPPISMLAMKKTPYPFCEETPLSSQIKQRREPIAREMGFIRDSIRQMEIRAAKLEGAVEAFDSVSKLTDWSQPLTDT